ncbi:MAG: hypothetical protein NZL89_01355 [Leptospiraceae bacterium]|nr:hypothetical protein [Leptospiraceae bacterium]
MRLTTLFVAVLIAVTPVVGQKKAAAKAPPTPQTGEATTTLANPQPAQNSPPAAPAKTADKDPQMDLVWSALFWGGYNFASSESFEKADPSSNLRKGGLAGGAEFLVGIPLVRGGVAVSYLPTFSVSPAGQSGSIVKAFLPIEGVLNAYLWGFFLGIRAGYLVDIGSSSISGQSYTRTPGTTFGGQVGYQYRFGTFALEVGMIYTFAHAEATGIHEDYNNVIPRIGLGLLF